MLGQRQLFFGDFLRLTDMQQIFDIALRSLDGGIFQMQYFETDAVRIVDDLADHFLVDLRLSHHTVLAHLASAGLELGLDQTHHLSAGL